jgi:hypothetical protein
MDTFEVGREVEVELDVFSGRPNPRWTLMAGRAEEVRELLRDLEPADRPQPSGLGYRGFVLTSGEAKASVFRGVVSVMRHDDMAHFRDKHGLEQHLLRQARDHGYDEVLTAFDAPNAQEG